jgi:hypothetical protein
MSFPLRLLLLVRLGDYIVNLCDSYCYKLIGKPTAFLQFQDLSLRNQTVSFFTLPPFGLLQVVHKDDLIKYQLLIN